MEAISVSESEGGDAFSPFGRGDTRVLQVTEADQRLLAGTPTPLRIPVTVRIDE
jgi:hypothetical protein